MIKRKCTSYSCYYDPGRPIPAEITSLTGIRDEDVAGQRLPDDRIVGILRDAGLVVAHNAAFDRKWIERRFPDAAGLPWACSMADVDWGRRGGFDGRKLGFLVMQCGYFYDAHRADVDVDAVIGLLRHRFDDGRTAMSVMMANAEAPSWFVRAHGAAFGVKDRLRARGYRWDPDRRVWGKEVSDADRLAEEAWLAANVYAADAHPRSLGPSFEPVTRWQRYA
jgi:DNA polymerase-3 subunit epsilon